MSRRGKRGRPESEPFPPSLSDRLQWPHSPPEAPGGGGAPANRRAKRGDRPESSDIFPATLSKRLRRPLSPQEAAEGEEEGFDRRAKRVRLQSDSFPPLMSQREREVANSTSSSPSLVMVTGLPFDCTVLELKSHLEVYGPISRTRIDADCRGYVTFRSNQAAEAAIAASLDPAIGVSIRSKKLIVVRESEDPVHSKERIRISPTSKLLRPELPLSRYGRSNKKLDAATSSEIIKSRSELPNESREIVAYDDLF